MFGFRGWEWLIILLIILLIFGSTQLPRLGQALGKTIRGFRKSLSEEEEDTKEEESEKEKQA